MDAALRILNRGTSLFADDGVGLHMRRVGSLLLAMTITGRGTFTFKVMRHTCRAHHPLFEARGVLDFTTVPDVAVFERGPWEAELLALDG
jgi:hypothetical protein